MTTEGPNLFDFATSELSQDAFLCWVIANARQDERADLRDLGRAFIGWLWDRARAQPAPIEQVQGANESEIAVLFFDDETNTITNMLGKFRMIHLAFLQALR